MTASSRFYGLLPLWEKAAKPDEGCTSQHYTIGIR
jgi:hypothetical protein